MPTYSSVCTQCGTRHTYARTIASRADTPHCCGEKTEKVIDTPQVSAMAWTGWKGFEVAGAGGERSFIESGSQLKTWMEKNNYLPASEGNREAEINRAKAEKAHAEKRRDDVIKVVNAALN